MKKEALFLMFLSLFYFGLTGVFATEQIRESVIAGSWYPGEPEELRKAIRGYLDTVPEPDLPGKLVAIISPHAGYRFSGPVAAYTYKILEKVKFDTVVIIAPSHYARFSGFSVYDKGGYRTPLGVVPLDTEFISALKKKDTQIRYVPEAHLKEHSLEIQIPFLQVVMPGFKLVPIVMGDQTHTGEFLAEALADLIRDRSVLIVASSDLSHFHSDSEAKKLDQIVQDRVKEFNPEELSRDLNAGRCEACGGGAIVTAMIAARKLGANRSQILKYATSGDITDDKSRVVGYMAAALWDNPGSSTKTKSESDINFKLSTDEKKLLHQIARETITAKCLGKSVGKYEIFSPALNTVCGAFVTLKKAGELRGCIGNIVGRYPLAETIKKMAEAAAFQDPRFTPVTAAELNTLEIEISVLTPLKKISNVEDIRVGTHGIYIIKGYNSGVLLPQVATENNWDRMTFLEYTCRKAGLSKDSWKEKDTEIYIFSAEIF